MKALLIFVISVSIISLAACNKDEDEKTSPLNQTTNNNSNLLQSHYWRVLYVAGTYTDTGSTTIDIYQTPDSCEVDDQTTFEANGLMLTIPNTINCGAVNDTNYWSFMQNQSKILAVFSGDSILFNIEVLTANRLRLVGQLSTPAFTLSDTTEYVYP